MSNPTDVCEVCNRPILGCTCGEPEVPPFTSPLDNN